MPTNIHIAIVGAGAAGLAAAIFAAEARPDLKIVLFDSARSLGAKILVSGGGRCNVTNAVISAKDFHAPPRIVERVLKRFTKHDTIQWFESLGVSLKQEATGKIFPVSNKARTVLEALLRQCEKLGIEIRTNHRVQGIRKIQQQFQIQTNVGVFTAQRIIMATGGKSLPKSGSDGSGWTVMQHLGHTITDCQPALVPLVLSENFIHKNLSGTSHEAMLSTTVDGKIVDRRTGSVLWTHFGVSGPVIMDASRFWVKGHAQKRLTTQAMSFFPEQTFKDVDRWLLEMSSRDPQKSLVTLLSQRLPQRVAKTLCAYVSKIYSGTTHSSNPDVEISASPINQLPRLTRRVLTHTLTGLQLPIERSRGWNFAEVTAGGIPLQEINVNSMESRKISGLYVVGEILDCDGRIGGFNFQWAWSTGYIAGGKAGQEL
ncbi:NAD(P)/FAD-dependent oxidoreductase [Candidatus Nitrospira salsa]